MLGMRYLATNCYKKPSQNTAYVNKKHASLSSPRARFPVISMVTVIIFISILTLYYVHDQYLSHLEHSRAMRDRINRAITQSSHHSKTFQHWSKKRLKEPKEYSYSLLSLNMKVVIAVVLLLVLVDVNEGMLIYFYNCYITRGHV